MLAKDGGSPIRTGTLTLNITVEDVNDNSPVFTTNQYNVSVNETLSKNSFVIKVIATDCDIGFNGKASLFERTYFFSVILMPIDKLQCELYMNMLCIYLHI